MSILPMPTQASTATTGPSGAGRNSRTDMISMLTQLAPTLFGSGTTTTTTTGGKNITPEQLQALIGNMMSSTNGLASVLMPQRQAGLYNSPVNSLLAQQLTSRVAGEAADKSTSETKTMTQKTAASPAAGPLAGILGALQAGSMLKKGWDNKDAIGAALKDPAGALRQLINGPDYVEPVMEAVAGTGAAIDSFMPSIGFGASAAPALGDASAIGNFMQSIGFTADAPATLGFMNSDIFTNLLAPSAVPDLTAALGMNQIASMGADAVGSAGADLATDAITGAGSAAVDAATSVAGDMAIDGAGAAAGEMALDFGVPYVTIARGVSMLAEELFGNNIITNAFDGIMAPVNEIVGGVIGGIEDIGGGIIDGIGDIGDAIGDFFGGGCFLTTACMVALADDFKDDCRELEAMRALRDGYMQTLDEGPALIQQYYKTAPSYVMWINAREDAEEVWKSLYSDYILPAVVSMEKEHYHKAYETYVRMVKEVERLVHEEEGV